MNVQEIRKAWNTPTTLEGQCTMCRYCKNEDTQREGTVIINGEEQNQMSCYRCKAKWSYKTIVTEQELRNHNEWLAMLKVENDIIIRYCDVCGGQWGGGDPRVKQKLSVLGQGFVDESNKKVKFVCSSQCSIELRKLRRSDGRI